MKSVCILALTAALAAAAWASPPKYEYEGQWGKRGQGDGEFRLAAGVAVAPRGNVYVTDRERAYGRVQYFTSTGSFIGKWGSPGSGNGQFDNPLCIAVAPNGNIYVSDFGNDRIQYFTPTGSFLGKWGSSGLGNGEFYGPSGVAVAPSGTVYVTEMGGEVPWGRVQCFTPTGSFLGKWGSYGSGNGEFDNPWYVAVAPNGNVYVCDYYNRRIQYFTSTGSFLGKWGELYPVGVAVAPDGNSVYVSEYWNDRIQYFTPTGSFLGKWGEWGKEDGEFNYPEGVAVAPNFYVYVGDSVNGRVQYFKRINVTVTPASLGRVKALFR